MASNLTFISDVIYGLKIEYGELAIIGRRNATQDQMTGLVTQDFDTFPIGMVVALPENLREAFLRSVGIKKEGRLKKGDREFLIDKMDIPAGRIIDSLSYIEFDSKKYDVTEIDDYTYAMVVTANHPVGAST